MRVLVACEFSAIVRDAFIRRGHDAWSCDLRSCPRGGPHIKGNVLDVLDGMWDLMIAHPPCTHLAVSGALHFEDKKVEQRMAVNFAKSLFINVPIPRIALEQPVSVLSSRMWKPSQIVHPWMFGDRAEKTTCLWLKNLPPLVPTMMVSKGSKSSVINIPTWLSNASNRFGQRKRIRSKTFNGLAEAMADQWGELDLLPNKRLIVSVSDLVPVNQTNER